MAGYVNGGIASAADLTPNSYNFVNLDSITVNHALGYHPTIWIILSTGVLIEAAVSYGSGTFTITLSTALSGTVYYR